MLTIPSAAAGLGVFMSGKRRMDLVLLRLLLELGVCFITDGLPATGSMIRTVRRL